MTNSHQILHSQLLLNSVKHGITPLLFFILLLVQLPFSSAQNGTDTRQDPYSNMRFSPSLAIIIVVLISALFFMGFFSIYIRHCADASGASVRPLTRAQRSRRGVTRGLDQEVLETFPTFVYSDVKQLKIGKGALECAVCLNEFEDDETLRLIPKCDHVFHPECIDEWLGSHTTCPVCRTNLVPQPGESITQPGEPHTELDVEAQNDVAAGEEPQQPIGGNEERQPPEPQVININGANPTLNRNRTRRSRSSRPRKFPRSHSTGHSLVQPGENTERFTLRLPVEVRQQIMNRGLNRSRSLLVLPRESSSRRGYRRGGVIEGEGSNRGRNIKWLDRFGSFRTPFFSRASSLRSPRVTTVDVNETPVQPAISSSEPNRLIQPTVSLSDSNRLPV